MKSIKATKAQFKTMRSLYRYYLRSGENAYTRAFDRMFENNDGEVAFCDSGCSYSFPFAWCYGKKGSFRKERIVERNYKLGVIN